MLFEKIAVIDLGTNTFNLLIVEKQKDGSLRQLYKESPFVRLAEDGIERIGDAPFKRGLQTMQRYADMLKELGVKKVKAIGTAALRTANNGLAFVEAIKDMTGIDIAIIDGDLEAALIHKGVSKAYPMTAENGVIMDIGGGSVEFIICNNEKIYWAQSFPIGVAVLKKKFHHHEPINDNEKAAILNFLETILKPLKNALQQFPVKKLIGAAGIFDVLENNLVNEKPHALHSSIESKDFYPLAAKIVNADLNTRYSMEGVPNDRAEMIVCSLLLIDYVLSLSNFQQIIVSEYAIKEGVLWTMQED